MVRPIDRTARAFASLTAASLLALAAPSASAQTAPSGSARPPTTANVPLAQPSATNPPPDDAQIAAIGAAANRGEIAQARLAQQRAADPAVRQFADMMVQHHTNALREGNELLQREHKAPRSSAMSIKVTRDGQRTLASLRQHTGADFDRAYMDAQVTAHEQVLHDLDNTLIPNAQDPALRAQLEQLRPMVAAHLQNARQLQQTLAQSAAHGGGPAGPQPQPPQHQQH